MAKKKTTIPPRPDLGNAEERERFRRAGPPLDPDDSFQTQYEKWHQQFKQYYGDVPATDSEISFLYDIVRQQFRAQKRPHPRPEEFDPYIGVDPEGTDRAALDRIAPHWRKGWSKLLPRQIEELKRHFGTDDEGAIREHLDDLLEKDNPQWEEQRRDEIRKLKPQRGTQLEGSRLGGGRHALYAPNKEENLASFAGPNAKLNDNERNALVQAQELHKQNHPREEIWRKTGWFVDPRGHWWMEINDNSLKMKGSMEAQDQDDPTKRKRLGDIMDHPELYRLYPKLKDLSVGLFRGDDAEASFEGERIDITPGGKKHSFDLSRSPQIAGVLSHEWMHPIEEIEGISHKETNYGPGGEILPELNMLRRNYDMNRRRAKPPWTEYEKAIKSYPLDEKNPETKMWLKDRRSEIPSDQVQTAGLQRTQRYDGENWLNDYGWKVFDNRQRWEWQQKLKDIPRDVADYDEFLQQAGKIYKDITGVEYGPGIEIDEDILDEAIRRPDIELPDEVQSYIDTKFEADADYPKSLGRDWRIEEARHGPYRRKTPGYEPYDARKHEAERLVQRQEKYRELKQAADPNWSAEKQSPRERRADPLWEQAGRETDAAFDKRFRNAFGYWVPQYRRLKRDYRSDNEAFDALKGRMGTAESDQEMIDRFDQWRQQNEDRLPPMEDEGAALGGKVQQAQYTPPQFSEGGSWAAQRRAIIAGDQLKDASDRELRKKRLSKEMSDEVQVMMRSGKPLGTIRYSEVEDLFGPDAANHHEEMMNQAARFYALTGDFYRMPDQMIEQRLNEFAPSTGKRNPAFTEAVTFAKRLMQMRQNDPAAAVAGFPEVKAALQGGDRKALITARLEAQSTLGLIQAPLTLKEQEALLAPLFQAAFTDRVKPPKPNTPSQTVLTMNMLREDLEKQLGPELAEKVLSASLYSMRKLASRQGVFGTIMKQLSGEDEEMQPSTDVLPELLSPKSGEEKLPAEEPADLPKDKGSALPETHPMLGDLVPRATGSIADNPYLSSGVADQLQTGKLASMLGIDQADQWGRAEMTAEKPNG